MEAPRKRNVGTGTGNEPVQPPTGGQGPQERGIGSCKHLAVFMPK